MAHSGVKGCAVEAAPFKFSVAGLNPQLRVSEESCLLAQDILTSVESFRSAVIKGDKLEIRAAHRVAKSFDTGVSYVELREEFRKLKRWFRSSAEIEPSKIQAELRLVLPGSLEERLFKICRGYWSMPYSKGYGRRLRYVVFDKHHQSVIGIIGLHSAPADLACRDEHLGLLRGNPDKLKIINSTLDAYTLGAVPPYSALLAGKLVAGFVCAETIRRDYWRIYGSRKTLMGAKRLRQPLVAVTTSSAFGRSSIYNRLKFNDQLLATPVGFTKGFGTIHLEALYPRIEAWLKKAGIHVPAGFGNGPKVRWQNVTRAILALGLPRDCRQHGLLREVFVFPHVANLRQVCGGGSIPEPLAFNEASWATFWRERWALPRASRDLRWRDVDAHAMILDGLSVYAP